MTNPWDNDPIVSGPDTQSAAPVAAPVAPAATPGEPAPAAAGNPWDNDPIVAPAPSTPQSSTARGLGLGVRGAVQAVGSIPGAIYDAIGAPINAAMDLTLGSGTGPRIPHAADTIDQALTTARLPQAQNPTERVIQDVYKGAGAALGGIGAGAALESAAMGPITRAASRLFQQAPVMQVASGVASGAAQGIAREEGAGPIAQAAAGVAGAIAPSLIPFAGEQAIARGLRGGDEGAQRMQRNIDTFKQAAGATPTLGQATGNPAIQALETGSANTLMGDGIMQRAGRRQLSAMDGTIDDIVSQLASSSTPEDAGDAISRGVQSFKDSFKSTQKNLYGKLDTLIEPETPVRVDATKQAMADLNADIQGAPALSKWFKNAKIQGLQQALESDVAGAPESVMVVPQPPLTGVGAVEANLKAGRALGAPVPQDPLQVVIPQYPPTNQLPYEAVAKLRTLVGQELTNTSLVSDIPRSKWTALYAALSEDLGTAAAAAGPKAQQAWQRANDFTRAGIARLDRLDTVVSKDLPESIYKTAMGASGDGGTRIRTVMRSLPTAEKKQVIATTLERLGRAGAGAQDATGERFSSDVFLSNLNRMAPEAREALFRSNAFPGLGGKLDALAQMASIRKDSGKVFANPSGSGRFVVAAAQLSTLMHAIATGSPAGIASALAGISLPAGFAKFTTNPRWINRIASPGPINPSMVPSAAEAAIRGVSAEQQPTQHLADGGQVFRNYPGAARARFQSGGDFHIAPVKGGFSLVPKFADGGQVKAAPTPTPVIANEIDARAHEAASSPLNDRPEPTPAQATVGNYKKGHFVVQGMSLSIENPEGSTRRGVDPDGTPWESQIKGGHYGYLRGSQGADGDHLDVFVGPDRTSRLAHVVDQLKPDGSFDEHKALIGYPSAEAARAAYLSNYPKGQEASIGAMTSLPLTAFRAWARSGKLKQPLAYEAPQPQEAT